MPEKIILQKFIRHFSSLLELDFHLFDVSLREFSEFSSSFCSRCPHPCDYKTTHLYGCYESARWDRKYIYYCQMDFIFIAVPILEEYDMVSGGIIAGPILMGEPEDFSDTFDLPILKTSQVNDMAEIMSAVFTSDRLESGKESTVHFMNTVYSELENLPGSYPIELERNLQSAIVSGDAAAAREFLNRLLGDIFFQTNGELSVIKTRAADLLVLFSHAAIEGGAESALIFDLMGSYREELERFHSLEKLSLWLGSVLNRLVSYVFELSDVQHQDTLRKIIHCINENYRNKLTLDDIAEQVFMSKYHISRIFNEKMGMSVSAYINKVRVERSRQLLRDTSFPIAVIASMIGFEDQSYFTKQFKLLYGISPKKFREANKEY